MHSTNPEGVVLFNTGFASKIRLNFMIYLLCRVLRLCPAASAIYKIMYLFPKLRNMCEHQVTNRMHIYTAGSNLALKRAAIARFMFNMAFENSIEDGYVTEKPFDALLAGYRLFLPV